MSDSPALGSCHCAGAAALGRRCGRPAGSGSSSGTTLLPARSPPTTPQPAGGIRVECPPDRLLSSWNCALVSEADFVAAQAVSAPRGPAGLATRRYLLAGLLRCAAAAAAWNRPGPTASPPTGAAMATPALPAPTPAGPRTPTSAKTRSCPTSPRSPSCSKGRSTAGTGVVGLYLPAR